MPERWLLCFLLNYISVLFAQLGALCGAGRGEDLEFHHWGQKCPVLRFYGQKVELHEFGMSGFLLGFWHAMVMYLSLSLSAFCQFKFARGCSSWLRFDYNSFCSHPPTHAKLFICMLNVVIFDVCSKKRLFSLENSQKFGKRQSFGFRHVFIYIFSRFLSLSLTPAVRISLQSGRLFPHR